MTPFFHTLWLLCGMGAAVFAAASSGWWGIVGLAGGFAAALWTLGPSGLPDPVWIGCIAAATGTLHLFRPRFRFLTPLVGGALAAVLSMTLRTEGFPAWAAIPAAASVPSIALLLTRRSPDFAPERMREEAMLLVAGLGVVVAAAPGIAAGWGSALALNMEGKTEASRAIPSWVLATGFTSITLGGLYSLWRRG